MLKLKDLEQMHEMLHRNDLTDTPVERGDRAWGIMDFLLTAMLEEVRSSTPPTTESASKDSLLDAATGFTGLPTAESLQSGQVGMPSGPVERRCWCVEPHLDHSQMQYHNEKRVAFRCIRCRAYRWFDETPVPAAGTGESTYQKQASQH